MTDVRDDMLAAIEKWMARAEAAEAKLAEAEENSRWEEMARLEAEARLAESVKIEGDRVQIELRQAWKQRVERLEAELAEVKRTEHEPGCPAIADDASDYEHLVDAGICVCKRRDGLIGLRERLCGAEWLLDKRHRQAAAAEAHEKARGDAVNVAMRWLEETHVAMGDEGALEILGVLRAAFAAGKKKP